MHLSHYADCFCRGSDACQAVGPRRSHLDSLLRGVAVFGIATVLGGMTMLADMARQDGADAAPRIAASSNGSAVNLMHREVIGHR